MQLLFSFLGIDWSAEIGLWIAGILSLMLLIRKIIGRHIREWVTFLVEGVMLNLGRYVNQSMAARISLRRYCRNLLGDDRLRYLLVPSRQEIQKNIDEIFVPLTVIYANESEKIAGHSQLLDKGNRIRVMGDPGSGKSTLMKKLLREQCEIGVKSPQKARFPVLVELRTINFEAAPSVDAGKWFYELIRFGVGKNQVYKIEECFDIYAASKGILLLLDGLDEVASASCDTAIRCINGLHEYLTQQGHNTILILTMRTQYHQQVMYNFANSFPHVSFLQAFTPSDIFEFLSRWHFKKNVAENRSRIYKELTDKPSLREMCSNPLILSMYVCEDEDSGGLIAPETRTQFYKRVTDELIALRRIRQHGNSNARTLLKDQRYQILGAAAAKHLLNEDEHSNSLSWKELCLTISDIIGGTEEMANQVALDLVKETGLITPERFDDSYRFIHLTFCEFLAAHEMIEGRKNGWESLICDHQKFIQSGSSEKARLVEVIPFAAGMLKRVDRKNSIAEVAALNDFPLLARCFLEVKSYDHEIWPRFVTDFQIELRERSALIDSIWLQDLHLFNVVVKDGNLAFSQMLHSYYFDLNEFYAEFFGGNKLAFESILLGYARNDAAAVFRLSELCGLNLVEDFPTVVIGNCDQRPFLEIIIDKIDRDPIDSCKWASLVVESALRNRIVAFELNERPKNVKLSKLLRKDIGYRAWFVQWGLQESLYLQYVSLVLNSKINKDAKYLVAALAKIPAPSSRKFQIIFDFSLFELVILSVFILILLVNLFLVSGDIPWGVAVVMGAYVLVIQVFRRLAGLTILELYKWVLNLSNRNRPISRLITSPSGIGGLYSPFMFPNINLLYGFVLSRGRDRSDEFWEKAYEAIFRPDRFLLHLFDFRTLFSKRRLK